MAPVLNLVNRVAEAVEKEFPGKTGRYTRVSVDKNPAENHEAGKKCGYPSLPDRMLLFPCAQ